MKQISIEFLRVDIGIMLDKSHFLHVITLCKIVTTPTLKYLITKGYKYLSIQTLHTCTPHAL
jgi:hypothetical protein